MAGPLGQLADEIVRINKANGWDDHRDFGVEVALIHSEVSEAFEEYRAGRGINERYYQTVVLDDGSTHQTGKPEGIPSELADVLIRVLDVAHRNGVDLDEVVAEKLAYNATRGFRHGGKVV